VRASNPRPAAHAATVALSSTCRRADGTWRGPGRLPVPLSEARARFSELARRVRQQHERITLTRDGEAEAVLLSVDDLEGLEMTWKFLSHSEAVARISESLAALGRGEPGAEPDHVRQDFARAV